MDPFLAGEPRLRPGGPCRAGAQGDLDLHAVHLIVLSSIRRRGTGVGNPTAVIERAGGGPATTRTRGTVQALVAAAGGWCG